MVKFKFKARIRRRQFSGRKVYEITIPKLLADFFNLDNHIGRECIVTIQIEGGKHE